jgi:hypothetical protein
MKLFTELVLAQPFTDTRAAASEPRQCQLEVLEIRRASSHHFLA